MNYVTNEQSFSFQYRWCVENCGMIRLPNGKTIVVDPVMLKDESECEKPMEKKFISGVSYTEVDACDLILITHAHGDHYFSLKKIWEKFHAPILINGWSAFYLARELDMPVGAFIPMTDGNEYNFDFCRIKWLAGRHSEGAGSKRVSEPGPGDTPQERELGYRGTIYNSNFIIMLPNGMKIAYDAGRFEPYLLELEKYNPNVVLVHTEKDINYYSDTMCKSALRSGAQFVIPLCVQHSGENAEEMVRLTNEKLQAAGSWCKAINPKPGQWITFTMNCSAE